MSPDHRRIIVIPEGKGKPYFRFQRFSTKGEKPFFVLQEGAEVGLPDGSIVRGYDAPCTGVNVLTGTSHRPDAQVNGKCSRHAHASRSHASRR